MHFPPPIRLLHILAFVFLSAVLSSAETESPSAFTLSLADGQQVGGRLNGPIILTNDLGRFEFPADRLLSLSRLQEHAHVACQLQNGDHLEGKLLAPLRLQTEYGPAISLLSDLPQKRWLQLRRGASRRTVGAWSQAKDGVRARLVLAEGPVPDRREGEMILHLELQNLTDKPLGFWQTQFHNAVIQPEDISRVARDDSAWLVQCDSNGLDHHQQQILQELRGQRRIELLPQGIYRLVILVPYAIELRERLVEELKQLQEEVLEVRAPAVLVEEAHGVDHLYVEQVIRLRGCFQSRPGGRRGEFDTKTWERLIVTPPLEIDTFAKFPSNPD